VSDFALFFLLLINVVFYSTIKFRTRQTFAQFSILISEIVYFYRLKSLFPSQGGEFFGEKVNGINLFEQK